MSVPRFLIAVGVVIAVSIVGVNAWRNPEKAALDSAARAGAAGQFVKLPEGITHYDVAGPDSGRPVVLVHGFSVPYYIWDSTFSRLAGSGYRVIRYDLFGRGLSDRPAGPYDGRLYDGQLEALLDSLRITEPVDLLGLSFGGVVVSHFVASHAGRVRTLTLIDPAAEATEIPGYLRIPVIGPWLFQVIFLPGFAEGQLDDFLHPGNYPTWVAQYRPQMRYRGFGHALLSTLISASALDIDSLYAGVARTGVPVLLIWGRQDQTVPFVRSEVVRRDIPSVEFFPVDSSRHLPHIEHAALVSERLHAFLEEHPRR